MSKDEDVKPLENLKFNKLPGLKGTSIHLRLSE